MTLDRVKSVALAILFLEKQSSFGSGIIRASQPGSQTWEGERIQGAFCVPRLDSGGPSESPQSCDGPFFAHSPLNYPVFLPPCPTSLASASWWRQIKRNKDGQERVPNQERFWSEGRGQTEQTLKEDCSCPGSCGGIRAGRKGKVPTF